MQTLHLVRACMRRSKWRVVVRFLSLVYDPKCCGVSPKISTLLSRLELQQQQQRQLRQQRRVSGFGAASPAPSAAAFSGGFGSAATAAGSAFGSSAPPPPPEAKAAVAQVEGGDGAFGAVTFVVDKPANVK